MNGDTMDIEKALIEAGYNLSTVEGEFNLQDFPVVGYGCGEEIDIEGNGIIDLAWVEPDPPTVDGSLERTVSVLLVGQHARNAELNAKVTATVQAVNIEEMEVELEGQKTVVWRCRARYKWEADFEW